MRSYAVHTGDRLLGIGLVLLGAAVAAVAVFGPLVFDLLRYRTSATSMNQILGGDAAALVVVAPVSIAAGVLALRKHPAAPVLALAPSIFVVYTYTQLIVGNEYLRLPGNVERFFPLMLGVFILAGAIAIRSWSKVPADRLPPTSAGADRIAGVLLLAIAVFVVVGLHLPSFVDAIRDQPTAVQYLSSPTPFWLVKLMDLGIIVPAAVAVGVGALRHRPWARKPVYAILGVYTLIGASVAGMGTTMSLRDDPDASLATLIGMTLLALLLGAATCYIYRPLFRRGSVPSDQSAPGISAPTHLETSTA
jgi:hypothetical protein